MTDVKNIDGDLTARGTRFGITVARFNSFISERLLEGALDALTRHGADAANIEVVRVPGAFEMPLVLKAMAESKNTTRSSRSAASSAARRRTSNTSPASAPRV